MSWELIPQTIKARVPLQTYRFLHVQKLLDWQKYKKQNKICTLALASALGLATSFPDNHDSALSGTVFSLAQTFVCNVYICF